MFFKIFESKYAKLKKIFKYLLQQFITKQADKRTYVYICQEFFRKFRIFSSEYREVTSRSC